MSDETHYDPRAVRHAYEAILDDYSSKFVDEFTTNAFDRSVIDDAVATVPAGGCVVDLGCGPGQVSAYLAGRGLRLVGLDLSSAMLQVARNQPPGLPVLCGDCLALPLRDGAVDGIVAWYSLHNLPRSLLSTALAECRRVLRTGGTAVIGTHEGRGDETIEQDRDGSTETVVITYYEPEELADAVTRHGFGLAALRQRPPLGHEHPVTKLYITGVAND
jgi:SAM-dependent methyltransferase